MINYLYYKLYRASLTGSLSDVAESVSCSYFGGLISMNIFVLNGFLSKINVLPFAFSSGQKAGIFIVVIILLSYFYFFYKKRYLKIIEKYSKENNSNRIRGNKIVWFYVAISFLSIFAIAFFKPGHL